MAWFSSAGFIAVLLYSNYHLIVSSLALTNVSQMPPILPGYLPEVPPPITRKGAAAAELLLHFSRFRKDVPQKGLGRAFRTAPVSRQTIKQEQVEWPGGIAPAQPSKNRT